VHHDGASADADLIRSVDNLLPNRHCLFSDVRILGSNFNATNVCHYQEPLEQTALRIGQNWFHCTIVSENMMKNDKYQY
jgi:hypothetical protein